MLGCAVPTLVQKSCWGVRLPLAFHRRWGLVPWSGMQTFYPGVVLEMAPGRSTVWLCKVKAAVVYAALSTRGLLQGRLSSCKETNHWFPPADFLLGSAPSPCRYVCIAMEALDQLLMACHCQSINLFVESFLKMVAKLLESEKPNLQILGTNSVRSSPSIASVAGIP